MNIADYKLLYNVATVHTTQEYQKQNLSKMWKERFKQKKWIDKYKKNKSSIFDYNYWIKQGYVKEEAIRKVSEIQTKNANKSAAAPKSDRNKRSSFRVEFWINKGYSEKDAIEKISKTQTSLSAKSKKFTGKIHSNKSKLKISNSMKRYSEKLGADKLVSRFGNFTTNYKSLAEIELFDFVQKDLGYNAVANEFVIGYNVDIKVDNKIIEYFGDYWHCSNRLFETGDIHPTYKEDVTIKRNYDINKISKLKQSGYDILIIWEHDYNENAEIVKHKIKKFLNDTYT